MRTTLDLMRELAAQISRDYPGSLYEFTAFPSGAAQLEVKAGGEIWVMEYLPSLHGVGVSRMSTATFGWEGFENAFDDFHEAHKFLVGLLGSEGKQTGA